MTPKDVRSKKCLLISLSLEGMLQPTLGMSTVLENFAYFE